MPDKSIQEKAKGYSRQKYTFAIIGIFYLLLLLWLFLALGLSKALAQGIVRLAWPAYLNLPAYLLLIYIFYWCLDFPLVFYSTFKLEHKFSLSKQKLNHWLRDQFKSGVIGYSISLILLSSFYYILRNNPQNWWLIVSLFWIFFSVILSKVTPVVIIPLFFKYKKLDNEELRQKIMRLAEKMRVGILDVFEIDFSKKTTKANAAFVGSGSTRRVILADTLKEKYNLDEIEIILAHEFAHYRLRHLLKLIMVNSLAIILSFYFIFHTSDYFLNIFGLSSLSDLAALPLVMLYLAVFSLVMGPFENHISRRLERNADLLALKETQNPQAFISMMDKLSSQNLADRKPHPLIKFFFFDHPPINERIALAERFTS
jgi:STE24 endopeptidase